MSRTILASKALILIDVVGGSVAGHNVLLDLVAYTIQVTAAMNGQELYSALLDYWKNTAGMTKYDFPIYPIDETSGKYQIGFDGALYNAWTWKDATTKKNLASIGWRQYNGNGTVAEEWQGVSTPPGAIGDTDQPYYQLLATDAPTNFTFAGPVNEAVQVFGDATHGNFDKRTALTLYVRPQGKTYSSANLASVSRSATGPYAQAFPLASAVDSNVSLADAVFTSAPYTSVNVTFFAANQSENIGGAAHNFNVVVDNSTAQLSLAQLYQYLQYLSRQSTNINQGAGANNAVHLGQTTGALASFVGTTFVTAQGVYVAGVQPSDINNVQYTDVTGATATNPFTASGTINFNSLIQAAGANATYTLYFDSAFGSGAAVVVNDANGNPITGSVGGAASVSFTFAYDSNTQGGRAAGTDAGCDLVVIAPNFTKYLRVPVTLKRASGQVFTATGQADSVYVAA